MALTLSAEQLQPLWPRASGTIIAGTVAAWPAVQAHYGFNTPLRCAHFWGQITVECGGGTELRESGNYTSAARILAVFGKGHHSAAITPDEAKALVIQIKTDHGQALFNRVYGVGNPVKAKELGNIGPNDGWLYRGAGALNTTGRDAFIAVGKAINQDFIANPDLANDPGISLWMGAEEYVNELHCFQFADAENIRSETKRINGGFEGLQDRIDQIGKWQKVFN
jgi:putative chitinase